MLLLYTISYLFLYQQIDNAEIRTGPLFLFCIDNTNKYFLFCMRINYVFCVNIIYKKQISCLSEKLISKIQRWSMLFNS